MKAAKFKYVRPTSLEETFELLERYGQTAQLLAGGQSLLAGLVMRLSSVEVLIDIGDLDQLAGISQEGNEIVVGALTRHTSVLNSSLIRKHLPLFAEAITHVGHVGIRNRGTFGGSLAYADPAAEMPACVVAQAGTVIVGGSRGRRRVASDIFFTGLLETALQPGEMILEVRLPAQRDDQVHVFSELSRRHGDFALVGLAGLLSLENGTIREARLGYFGCVDHAGVARTISGALVGRQLPLQSTEELTALLTRDLSPGDSPGMRTDTKIELAAVITRRALNGLRGASSS